MQKVCRRITEASWFDISILSLIAVNAIVIGLETSSEIVVKFGHYFEMFHGIVLGIFVLEAALKIAAQAPRIDRYFREGWNVFDFMVIVLSFIPFTDKYALVVRLVRVLRIVRVMTVLPELRLIILTLLRTLPSMGHIVVLLGLFLYIYAVMGFYLFSKIDLAHWGNLGAAFLTLFGIMTLETWVDVMKAVLPTIPHAWIFFVSFIIVGTFMFMNLFVAVVINNLVEAKKEKPSNNALDHQDLVREVREVRAALLRLEKKVES
jgi:voltage-gated sodium channel